MKKIHYGLIVLAILLSMATMASARISVGISLPNVSVGINVPIFPELAPVPGYPVYYAPQLDANYFFYDGMYWVYEGDNWYASSWYDGPWDYVEPEIVPLFVLRVPVAYYRNRPASFRGWHSNAPPRWGQHWGHDWEQHRSGWDRWDRRSAPARAPRPDYQRKYSKDRYPRGEQQQRLHNQNYRYQPRDQDVRQHFNKRQTEQRAPAPAQRGGQQATPNRDHRQQDVQRAQPQQQQQRNPVVHEQQQRPQDQNVRSQDHGKQQKDKRGNGHDQEKDEDRGHGRDRKN